MLHIQSIKMSYQNGIAILNGVNLEVDKGHWCSIMGPSGTGKSTLLNCISGLTKPDEGNVHIGEQPIYELNKKELSTFRRANIGFVFQDFKLLPHYSILDNVMIPLLYDENSSTLEKKAKVLLEEVGIGEHLFRRLPESLSGGEKQRVAIARSLIAEPILLLCDEPTGNLDRENRNQITSLLLRLKNRGISLVVVTHDEEVAMLGDRSYKLKDGILEEMVMQRC